MPKRTGGGEGKKWPLNMRTTKELREKLEETANKSGRSLVQEVEHRLEQSFRGDHLISVLSAGKDNAKLLRMIAWAMEIKSERSGAEWRSKKQHAQIVRRAIDLIVAAFASLPAEPPREDFEEEREKAKRGETVPYFEARDLAFPILRQMRVPLPEEYRSESAKVEQGE